MEQQQILPKKQKASHYGALMNMEKASISVPFQIVLPCRTMKAISETEKLQEGKMIQFYRRMFMERENNLITEQGSADIEDDTCASSLPENIVRRTIGKTTYVVSLHFKEQGQTFSQKLKRVLKADCSAIL